MFIFYLFQQLKSEDSIEMDSPELFLNASKTDDSQKIYLETSILVEKDINDTRIPGILRNIDNFDNFCVLKIKQIFKSCTHNIKEFVNSYLAECNFLFNKKINEFNLLHFKIHNFNVFLDSRLSDFYKNIHNNLSDEFTLAISSFQKLIIELIDIKLYEYHNNIIMSIKNNTDAEIELNMDINFFIDLLGGEIDKFNELFKTIKAKFNEKINFEKSQEIKGMFIMSNYNQNRKIILDDMLQKYNDFFCLILEQINKEKIKIINDVEFLMLLNNNYKFSKIFSILNPVKLENEL